MDLPPLLKNPARADLALLVTGCAKPRATKNASENFGKFVAGALNELIKSSGDSHIFDGYLDGYLIFSPSYLGWSQVTVMVGIHLQHQLLMVFLLAFRSSHSSQHFQVQE